MAVCPNDGEVLLASEDAGPTASIRIEPPMPLTPPTEGLDSVHSSIARQRHVPVVASTAALDSATSAESPSARRGSRSGTGASSTGAPAEEAITDDNPEARVGTTLGKYRVLRMLGRGGMGCVYEAEHQKLGRRVALKLLRSKHARRRDAVARFFQEARAVNRIRHRNIVDATDFVELDDGTTFIVMEFLDGASLTRILREGSVDLPRALAILIQICDGLDAAHQQGIVHRDLKPDNVVVVRTSDGADLVKLLDFGVAKLLYQEDDGFGYETAAGAVIGTPAFMSPEQAGGMKVDERADIYSLGAIMYLVFCGRPVFEGNSFGEFVRKHLNETPTPPSQTAGGRRIDEALEQIILQCLEKEPDNRFQTVIELRNALVLRLAAADTGIMSPLETFGVEPETIPTADLVAHPSSVQATPLPPTRAPQPPTPAPGAETAMTLGDLPGPGVATLRPARKRWPLYAAAAALIGGTAAIAILLTAGNNNKQARDPDTTGAATKTATTAPGPTLTPLTPSAPATSGKGKPVTVRFLSTPPGASVHAAGSARKHCDTPCDVTIDPNDGGAVDRRDYVLRRSGFAPGRITIDLQSTKGEVSVALRRRPVEPRAPHSAAPPVAKPTPTPRPRPPSAKPTPTAKRKPPVSKPTPTTKPKPTGPIAPSHTIDPFAD
jgi:serine/threonine-protein kinase